jgi:hypothetical protein
MAERITNAEILAAVKGIEPVISVRLGAIEHHLAKLNGNVTELQHDGAGRETRLVVLEHNDEDDRKTLEDLQNCVMDMRLDRAKSATIGAVVASLITAMVTTLPKLIEMFH